MDDSNISIMIYIISTSFDPLALDGVNIAFWLKQNVCPYLTRNWTWTRPDANVWKINLFLHSGEKSGWEWASLVVQLVKTTPAMQETWFNSPVGKIPWRREWPPTPVFLGFPGGSDGKQSACNAGNLGLIPGWGRSPGEGNGTPLQYSCLENPLDGIAWEAAVHGGRKESDTTERLHFPFFL